MRLDDDDCWTRVRGATHGVLGTVHEARGVDLVPVVFAVVDHQIVVPIDTVKPKSTIQLQRIANVEADPRCSLLVDHDDDDWSRLWWVRVHADATVVTAPTDGHRVALAERFPQYEPAASVAAVLVLAPDAISGWAASARG